MNQIQNEPTIAVGIMTGAKEIPFRLTGEFILSGGQKFLPGAYQASEAGGYVQIHDGSNKLLASAPELRLIPSDFSSSIFTLTEVAIGIDFHWERNQEQGFQGSWRLIEQAGQGITVINRIPLESYLTSVIASEMSASCPPDLLKAHAIISRSWLLAQISGQRSAVSGQPAIPHLGTSVTSHEPRATSHEIIRWYSRESHTDFDVCADDHCQRYQGITKASSPAVFDAIQETRGSVLVSGNDICDARFSKCCGGMSEDYRAAWEDVEMPYLVGRYDGATFPADFALPLTQERAAEQWILSSPPAYCNMMDPALIQDILPDFDQETQDFFRWEVVYTQDELKALVEQKLGLEFGRIVSLEPVERGCSGRLIRLKIVGEKTSVVIGKELEIRRALAPSHLYSSAFVVRTEGKGTVPERFRLSGAGWGHGVGLCQIGAAVMAHQEKSYQEILAHYYRGSSLQARY